MHIPDGIVSDPVNTTLGVVAALSLAASVWGMKKQVQAMVSAVPLFAVMTSFLFAAQMLNFPIGGGTSGHLLGAVLATAVLGPWGACLALAVVLGVQGVFFGDGGLSALGSNIVNMGVVGGLLVYPVLRKVRAVLPEGPVGFYSAVGVTSWFSLVLASTACSLELAISGTSSLAVVLPAMVGTHAVMGLGEAVISIAALAALFHFAPSVRPSWARMDRTSKGSVRVNEKGLVAAGLALALALALFVSPFASGSPDGLEKLVQDKGFVGAAPESTNNLFANYQVGAIDSERLSTGFAGFIGSLLAFGFALGTGRGVLALKK